MKRTFWIVAAGTGGHIFPGISLAEEIKKRIPTAEFLFFGTSDRLESKLVPQSGYKIEFLNASQWKGKGILGKISSLFLLIRGYFQILKKLENEKPEFLIGVGGYVSVPVSLACARKGIPIYLVEPNIIAGLANKILSRFAKKAFSVPGSNAQNVFYCDVLNLGNPVMSQIMAAEIKPEVKKILILGGSQGARKLCEAGIYLAAEFAKNNIVCSLKLQSGQGNLEFSKDLQIKNLAAKQLEIVPFIENMAQELQGVDIIIARAGAMTVAELCMAGLPTIFVPFPYAADNHQMLNADILREDNAAYLVDETLFGFEKNLLAQCLNLLEGERGFIRRKELSRKLKLWARPKATKNIIDQIFS